MITLAYEVEWSHTTFEMIIRCQLLSITLVYLTLVFSLRERFWLVITAWLHVLWWCEIKVPFFFPSLGGDCWLVLSWLSFSTYLQCFPLGISLLLMSLKVCDKLIYNKNWERILMFLFLSRYNLPGNFLNLWVYITVTSINITSCNLELPLVIRLACSH